MKTLITILAVALLLAACSTLVPSGSALADDATYELSDGADYTVPWEQPAHYKFVPLKSITAYELAMVLKAGGLSFYISEDDYSALPQELKKYLKKED